ncbi:MAG: hypothetical protein ACMUIA_05220, partial [bacterium]
MSNKRTDKVNILISLIAGAGILVITGLITIPMALAQFPSLGFYPYTGSNLNSLYNAYNTSYSSSSIYPYFLNPYSSLNVYNVYNRNYSPLSYPYSNS